MNKTLKVVAETLLMICVLLIVTHSIIDEDVIVSASDSSHYYNYEGQTAYGKDFVLHKEFINALKANNFIINGYSINKNGNNKVTEEFLVEDQMFGLDNRNNIVEITFPIEENMVSIADFKKTYSKYLVSEQTKKSKQILTFETKNYLYTATFNKDNYLQKLRLTLD